MMAMEPSSFSERLPSPFAFGDPVFIRPAELSGIQQEFL
jgi:hypothetical protein